MRRLVLDASVMVKWVLWDNPTELHVQQALKLLDGIMNEEISIVQPPHWLVEVAGVVTRLRPQIALESMETLWAMNFKVVDSLQIFKTACELASKFEHHLFYTLYHAVAICHRDTTLITADKHYYRKASKQGSITLLADF